MPSWNADTTWCRTDTSSSGTASGRVRPGSPDVWNVVVTSATAFQYASATETTSGEVELWVTSPGTCHVILCSGQDTACLVPPGAWTIIVGYVSGPGWVDYDLTVRRFF